MKDRFKFRVWNTYSASIYKKENNKMIYLNNNKSSLSDLTENSKWKVMQCTGLKDKNGKLIYEGDIVINKWTEPEGVEDEVVEGVVRYDMGKFCIDHYARDIGQGENTITGNIYSFSLTL